MGRMRPVSVWSAAPPSPPAAARACRPGTAVAPRHAQRTCPGRPLGRQRPLWPVPRGTRVRPGRASRAARAHAREYRGGRGRLPRPMCVQGR
eukprot:4739333-Pleurochrysis_carterae.AAC.1